MSMKELTARRKFDIRFSEVDSMNIVWHGSYPLYFEDAREEFGKKYGLGYMTIFSNGYYAPLVELSFKYKKPLLYEMQPVIVITYVPTESAKLVFKYEIIDERDGTFWLQASRCRFSWIRTTSWSGRIPNFTGTGKKDGRYYDSKDCGQHRLSPGSKH